MKYIRQYTFLVLMIVSSIVYGAVKLEMASEQQITIVENEEVLASQSMVVQMGEAMTDAEIPGGEDLAEAGLSNGEALTGEETEPLIEAEEISAEVPEESREFQRVELDYLSDALFIGDSRTSTLYEYAGWDQTDFFVKNGLTVWEVWDKTMDGRKLEEVLSAKSYGKIYIMLGVNELGVGTAQTYGRQFQSVVEQVRNLQPDAVIFVEAILHVTANKDAEGTYINNAEINARNQEIQKLADDHDIFWLDVNEVMDEPGSGTLRSDYTFDGVHLKAKYIDVWREFLLDHGII